MAWAVKAIIGVLTPNSRIFCAAVSVTTPPGPTGESFEIGPPPWRLPLLITVAILVAVGVVALIMLGRGKGPEGATEEGARLEAASGAPPPEPPRGPMM
jgi:hypothetical protein